MENIFLLSPWSAKDFSSSTNSSLLYLKYYMADNGYSAKIIDCSEYSENYTEVLEMVGGTPDPLIGITAYTVERFSAYRLIRVLKEKIPGCTIVVGGRHFGYLAQETLKELPEVDIVVRGEGEITMKEICDWKYKSKEIADILGITYNNGEEITNNPERPLEKDIDKFRCFDVNDIEEAKKQAQTVHTKLDSKRNYFSVAATRGCPGRCVYCSLTSNVVRFRSVNSVVDEIEQKIAISGERNVSFGDSSFTVRKSYVEEMCNEITRLNLNIRFNCYSRVDIDVELLKTLQKTGMVSAHIGLETGSPRVLKAIRKHTQIDQFKSFCENAYELGIKLFVFVMISLPDETIEDVDMTIDLLKDMSKYIYYVGLQTTRIVPDAQLYRIAMEKGVLSKNFNWFEPYYVPEAQMSMSIISDDLYRNLPIYIEKLTIDEIISKTDEVQGIIDVRLSNFNALKQAVLFNLSKEGLKKITFQSISTKFRKFFKLAFYSTKNIGKEKNFK